jgi:hypothetical protein
MNSRGFPSASRAQGSPPPPRRPRATQGEDGQGGGGRGSHDEQPAAVELGERAGMRRGQQGDQDGDADGAAELAGHVEHGRPVVARSLALVASRGIVRALTAWGDEHDAPAGPRRLLWHADDEGPVDASGRCTRCGASVPARDTVVAPGPGLDTPGLERAEPAQDAVSKALTRPHRLLEPLRHA